MKHALLVWLIGAMQRKQTPVAFFDTHAGIGRYDLGSDEAQRTGEWRGGIGQLLDQPPSAPLARYLDIVCTAGAPNHYPGSPAMLQAMLRPQDRLVLCELHPEDHDTLRRIMPTGEQIAIHRRDGFAALPAFLPPPGGIRRALCLIDPPFEQDGEWERLETAISTIRKRFAQTVIAIWYPIKHRAPSRAFLDRLVDARQPDLVTAELFLRAPTDPQRLNGCGLLVANPPFGFEEAASGILAAIDSTLGIGQATSDVRRLTPERIGA